MRRNPKKKLKFAAILDFGGHFDFLMFTLFVFNYSYMHIETKITILGPIVQKL